MKVLMIGSDRNLFVPGSAVSERMKEYGTLVEELHIVVLASQSLGLKKLQIAPNVWVYPTNSFSKWFYVFGAAHLGKKIVYDNKFVRGKSVITTQDPFECGWAGLKVKRKWRLPLEVQLHTDPFSPYFTGFLNRVRMNIARKVLRNADSVRVVTLKLKDEISNFTSAHITVLPIYVDVKKIEEARLTFDLHARYHWHFIILIVSRLAPEKNLPMALDILARVRQKFPDTGLLIVGSGPEEGKLRLLTKSLNLDSSVAFVGWQNDLTSYYKTANAYLQTSYFEGYGMTIVEAGLSGLPIVTTPVGIATQFEHGKDAFIYPVTNPELFASGTIQLIENNQMRENLRINMKNKLETLLVSKADYMAQLKLGWEEVSKKVK